MRDDDGNILMRINAKQVRKVEQGVAYRCLIEDSKCVLKELDKEEYDHLFGSQSDLRYASL